MRKKIVFAISTIAALLLAMPQWLHSEVPQISFITCFAGSDIYELEGHSAIRIQDQKSDETVNWGLFDFDSPNFVYRFVKGETDYWVGSAYTPYFLYPYAKHGRKVAEQVLDLDSVQTMEVLRLIDENLQPQNRIYRYNYVKDNCATRPLEIIEQAIGSNLVLGPAPAELTLSEPTFRKAMRHYHRNYPWYQFGIDMALGSGIDYRLSNRELSFAPEALYEMLATAQIEDPSGERRPLVKNTNILNAGNPEGATEGPTPLPLSPLFCCWALFTVGIAITIRDFRKRKTSRWFDTALFSIVGLAGCVVAFLVFVSVHEATSPNWILLWLNPLAFLGAILPWLKKTKKALICYQIVNFVLLLALLTVWACGLQSLNDAFLPLILLEMLRSSTYILQHKK